MINELAVSVYKEFANNHLTFLILFYNEDDKTWNMFKTHDMAEAHKFAELRHQPLIIKLLADNPAGLPPTAEIVSSLKILSQHIN
jgi:hypothetical protein